MIRKCLVLSRVAILVLLAVGASLCLTAWLANYLFPLAVLETIGLVDKGAIVGERWHLHWLLHEDDERKTTLDFLVWRQTITIDRSVYYPANPGMKDYHGLDFGPIRYRRWGNDSRRGSFRSIECEIALWFLWPLMGIWPVWAFVRGPCTRWKRRKHGCCLNCGYNLTGLPKPRCPECGNAVQLDHVPISAIFVSSGPREAHSRQEK